MNNRNGTGTMDQSQEKIGEKLDERIDSIKEQVKGLVDKGEQRAAAIKNRAIEVKDEAFTKGNELLDQVTGYIKSNPLKAVGIAFGAGQHAERILGRDEAILVRSGNVALVAHAERHSLSFIRLRRSQVRIVFSGTLWRSASSS